MFAEPSPSFLSGKTIAVAHCWLPSFTGDKFPASETEVHGWGNQERKHQAGDEDSATFVANGFCRR